MTREDKLREALIEARAVLAMACGTQAPYIKIALEHIDAALALKKPYTPPKLSVYGDIGSGTSATRARTRRHDSGKGRLKTA